MTSAHWLIVVACVLGSGIGTYVGLRLGQRRALRHLAGIDAALADLDDDPLDDDRLWGAAGGTPPCNCGRWEEW